MSEVFLLSEVFLAAGGAMFVVLGAAHGLLTLRDVVGEPRSFAPTVDGVQEQMAATAIGLNPGTNLWPAWLGFNFSHPVGLVVFGATAVLFAVRYHEMYNESVPL